ncbi:MAG: MBL fold metallo-hydrolase [Janthinobacterium lividum]
MTISQNVEVPAPVVPRTAATVIVARDGAQGMEVLLLRRAEREGDIYLGACVFPGGTVDAEDRELREHCPPGSAQAWPPEEFDGRIAAIRETFEEAGLLFAYDAHGALVDLHAHDAGELAEARRALLAGEVGFAEICRRLTGGVRLAPDRFAYFDRWLTPPGLKRRFDTRFFVAVAPPSQTALHDIVESVESMWLRPVDVLDPARQLKLMAVTRKILERLQSFETAAAFFEHASRISQAGEVPITMPRLGSGRRGRVGVQPSEAAYAEIGRLDPNGSGEAFYDIEPGRVVRFAPRVLRITAPNPGMMTGPGTNTYIVGSPNAKSGAPGGEWVVIDPGPADPGHVQAILDAAPGAIRAILLTHTHSDHWPASVQLSERSGAPIWGMPPLHADFDASLLGRVLRDGEALDVGEDTTLRVVHTPGHASNHLCYLLEEERTLFSGDHLMQGSTVVINPPDGDMAAYLSSLNALLEEELQWVFPGHGFLIADPHKLIRQVIAHRLGREAKVLAGMRAVAPADLDTLTAKIYDDVSADRHKVAARSLLAHLQKLQGDGVVAERDGQWFLQ